MGNLLKSEVQMCSHMVTRDGECAPPITSQTVRLCGNRYYGSGIYCRTHRRCEKLH